MSEGVLYPHGGGWLKNRLAEALVKFGQRRTDEVSDLTQINRRIPAPPELDGPHYNDSFVFQGASANGELFMSRLGFRSENRAEPWVFLELDGKKYVNDITHLVLEHDDAKSISAGGLTYHYDESNDEWQIIFNGPLNCEGDSISVQVSLRYQARSAMYLSSMHMDAASTGKAMAEMPWSRDYFQKLRSEQQSRIEQGATLRGEVTVDGKTRKLDLLGFRDHSWGKRDWTFIRRYIWNIFSLSEPIHIDSTPFEYVCFTTVDYSSSFKHLVSGWIAGPTEIRAIVASSNMHALCVDGIIPNDYTIVFQPAHAAPLTATVQRSALNHSWMLQNGGFEVNEAYCHLVVNGVSGFGMSEFGFSAAAGIPRPMFGGADGR